METAWRIEQQTSAGPVWFCGNRYGRWSYDSLEAVRFSRQQDAEAIIKWHKWKKGTATEHQWGT